MSFETYTTSFDSAIEETARQSLATHDVLEPLDNWKPNVNNNNGLVLTHKTSNRQYELTPHALNQLCVKSRVPTTIAKFLETTKKPNGEILWEPDTKDAEILCDIFNHHIWNGDRFDQEKPYLVRTNNDDNTIRAFLSERYAIVNNVWYLEKIREQFADTEIRAARWRGNADTIYGELIFPETRRQYDDSTYYAGLSIGNSEIGVRNVSLRSFVFREVCSNGLTKSDKEISRKNWKHLGSPKLDEIEKWIATIVARGNDSAFNLIEQSQNMLNMSVPADAMAGVFTQLLSQLKMSQSEQRKAWQFLEKERGVIDEKANSVFGIHSALTRYAQTLDNEAWVRTEESSSKLLDYNQDRVNRLVANAPNIDIEHLVV